MKNHNNTDSISTNTSLALNTLDNPHNDIFMSKMSNNSIEPNIDIQKSSFNISKTLKITITIKTNVIIQLVSLIQSEYPH